VNEKPKTKTISVAAREANLKRKIRRHLRSLGLRRSADEGLQFEGSGKEVIRALHSVQRADRLNDQRDFIAYRAPVLFKHFASGREIDPRNMSPRLERIFADSWQADLFRLASLTWSVPVSNGYGRRLRYSGQINMSCPIRTPVYGQEIVSRLFALQLGRCILAARALTASGHRGEVSYVAPRSEDIILK
jgi:hypothetical protein